MALSRAGPEPARDAGAAIARVLAAERAAGTAVAESAQQAEALRGAALARGKRITECAAARVAAVRAAIATRLAAHLAAIGREEAGPDSPAGVDEAARWRLERAIERLADELAGASPP